MPKGPSTKKKPTSGGSGVGVKGHSSTDDGVVGLCDAAAKSGVYGFNSYEGDEGAYGVFGRCNASEGAGVGAQSTLGVAVRGDSSGNDGIVGLSGAEGRSGVFGHNTRTEGEANGVFGRSDSPDGTGVWGEGQAHGVFGRSDSRDGTGVWGEGVQGDGVLGKTHGLDRSGVYGENTSVPEQPTPASQMARVTTQMPQTFGVKGRADASNEDWRTGCKRGWSWRKRRELF